MSKRVVSYILIVFTVLAMFAGCSSDDKNRGVFEAQSFVDECKILVPLAQFQSVTVDEFKQTFTKTVFDEFAASDYFKDMTEEERLNAFNELANILKTYDYGGVNGFIDSFSIDTKTHEITWHNIDAEYDILWKIPGY
jgi:hypothetical protein